MLDSGFGASVPPVSYPLGDAVDRLMYVSQCCVCSSVFEEMQAIREHALRRNVADQVHVALLYQAGWFMEWMEGPPEGVRAVLRRVARDRRHRGLRLIHMSRGPRRLTEPWSMAIKQVNEPSDAFEARVVALRQELREGRSPDPATIWRRLSMPLRGARAAGQDASASLQRVMVCSARGTGSFDLVRWLGDARGCEVLDQRFAGARAEARDVATAYVDLDTAMGSVVRRVVAMARNGLLIGLTQAFLADYTHVVLELSGSGSHDTGLMRLLTSACSRLVHRPVVVGIGAQGCDHLALRKLAHAGGLVYLDCDLGGHLHAEALWSAAEPALDFSLAANSAWLPSRQAH